MTTNEKIIDQMKHALGRALEQEEGLLKLGHEELGISTEAIKANIKMYASAITAASNLDMMDATTVKTSS